MKEWDQFLESMQGLLSRETLQKWIPKIAHFDAANIYLEAVDSFQISWFEEHIRPHLKGFVNSNGRPIKVHIGEKKREAPCKEQLPSFSCLPDPIDPDMKLENFIPTGANEVIYQLLQEEASGFNPIYLFGPKGSGKTHLLMGSALRMQKQGKRVVFVRAETFTEHVVQAMRTGNMSLFRKTYRDLDALIVDDIHILAKKTATQEEFFHTFNRLHTAGIPILLSGETTPNKLTEIESRLVSRFEWGITLQLETIEPAQILAQKALLWNIPLTKELSQFLLQRFKDPIIALQALHLRAPRTPTHLPVVEKILSDLLAIESEKKWTIDAIVKQTASHYGLTAEDILGKSQTKECALARQMAMHLCRKELKLPFQKIGEHFGRDHSTVMSSIKLVQKRIEEQALEEPALIHR